MFSPYVYHFKQLGGKQTTTIPPARGTYWQYNPGQKIQMVNCASQNINQTSSIKNEQTIILLT